MYHSWNDLTCLLLACHPPLVHTSRVLVPPAIGHHLLVVVVPL